RVGKLAIAVDSFLPDDGRRNPGVRWPLAAYPQGSHAPVKPVRKRICKRLAAVIPAAKVGVRRRSLQLVELMGRAEPDIPEPVDVQLMVRDPQHTRSGHPGNPVDSKPAAA